MTTIRVDDASAAPGASAEGRSDRRRSPIPTGAMIATRFMELRRRRGLMITLILVTVGLPTVFLGVRLVLHAIAPKTYGPAGGYDVYTAMSAGVLYTFGFIAAAALGCTAGSVDLSEGMFRHLVITGRSRLALYLARVPAGLAIIASLVAIGFGIVCAVCVFAAPTKLMYNGVAVPAGLSQRSLENWAAAHPTEVLCNFNYDGQAKQGVGCDNPPGQPARIVVAGADRRFVTATAAQAKAAAIEIADHNYPDYKKQFLYPSNALMIKTGLWLELEATVGFLVGLGLGSLLGQRTTAVILMIVLEIILTPIAIRTRIPHFINGQRGIIGVATAHLEPGQLPLAFGGGGQDFRVTESTTTAICVILAWLIGWTVIGAWRMTTRDA
ncbi:hypothetical protein M6D93_11875 [Jatrophihabitans telluris]|uniref:ABC transporter permease n=1 Tax=Jatrophihabitans telluris TaxID=2038343 RepID=A0ABY4QTH1_9ACTN|nr:hypothetical protein [Jatrophihabitans telluris]UQX87004.1 hypothetical protein M6D93_11875 [Jatrophihabitans telluris]